MRQNKNTRPNPRNEARLKSITRKAALIGSATIFGAGSLTAGCSEEMPTNRASKVNLEELATAQENWPLSEDGSLGTYADYRDVETKYIIYNANTREVEFEGLGYGLIIPYPNNENSEAPTRYYYRTVNSESGHETIRFFLPEELGVGKDPYFIIIATADESYSGAFIPKDEGHYINGNVTLAQQLVEAGIVNPTCLD